MREEVLLALVVAAVACISFMLGRMSMVDSAPQTAATSVSGVIQARTEVPVATSTKGGVQSGGITAAGGSQSQDGYVASKNGTKYHLPWCSGAKRIKEENKVWFKTKEEAEKAGYTPAANCKGI